MIVVYHDSCSINVSEKLTQGSRFTRLTRLARAARLVLPTLLYLQTLSVIFFFSFIVSMLFYAGIMQWVILKMGWMLRVAIQ